MDTKKINEWKDMVKMYDAYVKWFLYDCSDQYDELHWILDLLMNSKHKEDIMQVLKDTYKHQKQ